MTLGELREAILTALGEVPDLDVRARNAPFAVVRLAYADEPTETMGAYGIIVVDVRTQVFVSIASSESQDRLDAYLTWSGEESIKQALDKKVDGVQLGGVADSVWWTGAEELGFVEVDGVQYLAGEVRHSVRLKKAEE